MIVFLGELNCPWPDGVKIDVDRFDLGIEGIRGVIISSLQIFFLMGEDS